MLSRTERLALQNRLQVILGSDHVYFQPPSTKLIEYPCIVYNYAGEHRNYADDKKYLQTNRYELTLITKSPDPVEVLDLLSELPYCSFNREYSEDNLHHYAFTLHVTNERI